MVLTSRPAPTQLSRVNPVGPVGCLLVPLNRGYSARRVSRFSGTREREGPLKHPYIQCTVGVPLGRQLFPENSQSIIL